MGKEKKVLTITKKWLRENRCSEEDVEKYHGKVTIKRWRYGAKLRAQEKALILHVGTKNADWDSVAFTVHKLLGCIESAPFPITEQEILDLPECLGDFLENEVNGLVGMTPEDIRNLGLGSKQES